MKSKIVVILISSIVLSLIFTGCSNAKENEESVPAPSNTESVELDEPDAEANEISEDSSELEDKSDMVANGDWGEIGKYKVEEITDEFTDHGIYTLTYTSKAKTENIVKYFNELLMGTPNYLLKEIPTIGGMLKGTINENRITVGIQYDKSGDVTLVEFYSYDKTNYTE